MLVARLGGSLFLLALAATLPAQTAPPAASQPLPAALAVPTPTDPAQRLELGRKLNNLAGPDAKPWHLKATFQLYNEKGKPSEEGAFEEWWFSDKQYKVAYHSPSFNQEEYGTDQGVFRSGSTDWLAWPVSDIRDAIEHHIPPVSEMGDQIPEHVSLRLGADNLDCSAIPSRNSNYVDNKSTSFCFDPLHPILRYAHSFRLLTEITYDQISTFGELFIARNLRVFAEGAPVLSVHIDELESLHPNHISLLSPPADAVRGRKRIVHILSSNAPTPTYREPPKYPESAREDHTVGDVELVVRLGADGHVIDAHAVAGPKELRKATVDAMRKWAYQPRVIDGEPVEFELVLTSNFAIRR
ncbi:MAG TPA: energy transducer TonB [Terracidiphilus sp.]|jgi:TonB family protein|nr:energy transducer TonB [Terracidiphilus sp.]